MENETGKKALPIFNPAIPTWILTVVGFGIGIFAANLTKIFPFL